MSGAITRTVARNSSLAESSALLEYGLVNQNAFQPTSGSSCTSRETRSAIISAGTIDSTTESSRNTTIAGNVAPAVPAPIAERTTRVMRMSAHSTSSHRRWRRSLRRMCIIWLMMPLLSPARACGARGRRRSPAASLAGHPRVCPGNGRRCDPRMASPRATCR